MGKGGSSDGCCICFWFALTVGSFISGVVLLARGLTARDNLLDRDYALEFERLDQDCVILEVWTRQGPGDNCDDQYGYLFAYTTNRSEVASEFANKLNLSSYQHRMGSSSYEYLPWWHMLAKASEATLASVSGWSTSASRAETHRRSDGSTCDSPVVSADAASSYSVGDAVPCWIPRPGVLPIDGYNCEDVYDNMMCVKIFDPGEELKAEVEDGDHNKDILDGAIMVGVWGTFLLITARTSTTTW
eukprot:CAMPEP_0174754380 /NCGR_PEP_ID=MMETSP1094-20130205/105706_1 /TAXON_ID=156173 /ORGANISM="Chrysochromulina brevifilum, Strain UTEX LB 985" /LENGTH=244 /DNA_ID=CAMNT_0015960245 /DNA_START=97 /DNA_END=831 /DNA_ORIENTATION=+